MQIRALLYKYILPPAGKLDQNIIWVLIAISACYLSMVYLQGSICPFKCEYFSILLLLKSLLCYFFDLIGCPSIFLQDIPSVLSSSILLYLSISPGILKCHLHNPHSHLISSANLDVLTLVPTSKSML